MPIFFLSKENRGDGLHSRQLLSRINGYCGPDAGETAHADLPDGQAGLHAGRMVEPVFQSAGHQTEKLKDT